MTTLAAKVAAERLRKVDGRLEKDRANADGVTTLAAKVAAESPRKVDVHLEKDGVNGDGVNGDRVNGDRVNGDRVNGDSVNRDRVNRDSAKQSRGRKTARTALSSVCWHSTKTKTVNSPAMNYPNACSGSTSDTIGMGTANSIPTNCNKWHNRQAVALGGAGLAPDRAAVNGVASVHLKKDAPNLGAASAHPKKGAADLLAVLAADLPIPNSSLNAHSNSTPIKMAN